MSLCVSGLRENDDRLSAVDAVGNLIEGTEILLNALAAFPSEAIGRQESNPIEEAGHQWMNGEDIGSRQRVDVVVKGQRKGDVERVVGGVLMVRNNEIMFPVVR